MTLGTPHAGAVDETIARFLGVETPLKRAFVSDVRDQPAEWIRLPR